MKNNTAVLHNRKTITQQRGSSNNPSLRLLHWNKSGEALKLVLWRLDSYRRTNLLNCHFAWEDSIRCNYHWYQFVALLQHCPTLLKPHRWRTLMTHSDDALWWRTRCYCHRYQIVEPQVIETNDINDSQFTTSTHHWSPLRTASLRCNWNWNIGWNWSIQTDYNWSIHWFIHDRVHITLIVHSGMFLIFKSAWVIHFAWKLNSPERFINSGQFTKEFLNISRSTPSHSLFLLHTPWRLPTHSPCPLFPSHTNRPWVDCWGESPIPQILTQRLQSQHSRIESLMLSLSLHHSQCWHYPHTLSWHQFVGTQFIKQSLSIHERFTIHAVTGTNLLNTGINLWTHSSHVARHSRVSHISVHQTDDITFTSHSQFTDDGSSRRVNVTPTIHWIMLTTHRSFTNTLPVHTFTVHRWRQLTEDQCDSDKRLSLSDA